MGKIITLMGKISLLEKQLEELNFYKKFSREDILSDKLKRGSFERDMCILADLVIQICENVNSVKKHGYGMEYRKSMEITLKFIKFPQEYFDDFLLLSGFRNILAHEYADINYNILFEVYENKIYQIEKFLEKVKNVKF